MKIDVGELAPTKEAERYLDEIQRRLKESKWAIRSRSFGIQASWAIVLVAGASIAVSQALNAPRWVAAILGLTVVVFQGAERIFARTSGGFEAVDVMRRDLDRETRLFAVSEGDYRVAGDRFALYVEKCEEVIAANDAASIDYHARMAGDHSQSWVPPELAGGKGQTATKAPPIS